MARIYFIIHIFIICIVSGNLSFAQGKSFEAHINLGKAVNTPYDEQNLVLSADGNTLFYTIAKHPENEGGKRDKGDIWFSQRDNSGNWGEKVKLGAPVNNKFKNAVLAVLNEGNTLLLQGHYSEDGSSPKTQGISVSFKTENEEWSFPQPLPMPYFMNKSEDLSLTISTDENVMILSMESYGTYGAEDLYISFKKDGTWSDPQNLGRVINTPMQELSPYLSADGKTLYFSSNGRKGFGSKDVYVTTRKDDSWLNWTEPVNLGAKVNTGGSETFFILPFGSEEAFMISTQNSDGYGDINRLNLKKSDKIWEDHAVISEKVVTPSVVTKQEKRNEDKLQQQISANETLTKSAEETNQEELKSIEVSGKVYNSKTSGPVDASVTLFYDKKEVYSTQSNASGEYKLNLPKTKGSYLVKIASKGYYEAEEKIEIGRESTNFKKDFSLIPLEVGTTIQLENILFERGTANLLDESYPELERVINMLNENPGMEIELSGHTDNSGSFKLNLELSQKRVEEVKKILVEKGIDEKRIVGKGYGGTRPIASNKNEESRKLNRRVEFTITKVK